MPEGAPAGSRRDEVSLRYRDVREALSEVEEPLCSEARGAG
jgi:hypothetical protein